jgi:hypothetical protein
LTAARPPGACRPIAEASGDGRVPAGPELFPDDVGDAIARMTVIRRRRPVKRRISEPSRGDGERGASSG